ncbi:hypothetical protein BC938DRAFT_475695 [Jimgerdemannia flammicorona]|uniref:Uncharacterized protein n=1 Tax=Jimgerdemannia flammicorona TaxID=994334 RepID=A0A433QRB8_9FUNG|nr:hypothetical protein BC938DRAFT_475695 [Jimgerdemannia flammicorona]
MSTNAYYRLTFTDEPATEETVCTRSSRIFQPRIISPVLTPDTKSPTSFGKLSLGLLTTSPTLHALSTTLLFAHAEHLPTPPPAVTLAHHIQSLLSANPQSTTTPIDVLFIHLSPPVPATPDAYRPLIDLVDAVFAALLDTTPKVLKIALTSWAADEPSGCANTLYLDPPTDLDERASFLRPKQSHVTKDGEEVAVDTTYATSSPFSVLITFLFRTAPASSSLLVNLHSRGPITALYHHHGSTRRDATARFTEREVLERGENGRILAWHFLAEVGYKLGFVPKYGA